MPPSGRNFPRKIMQNGLGESRHAKPHGVGTRAPKPRIPRMHALYVPRQLLDRLPMRVRAAVPQDVSKFGNCRKSKNGIWGHQLTGALPLPANGTRVFVLAPYDYMPLLVAGQSAVRVRGHFIFCAAEIVENAKMAFGGTSSLAHFCCAPLAPACVYECHMTTCHFSWQGESPFGRAGILCRELQ